ncbi:hypothetical protein Vafri_12186 [Volvox africanus]|uniref:Uncharacterized protein n=1 Tax=Volvox africanus TaxID=51714 RepID=A0A8J4F550_9CHLO|nr:hypothetical protein Vafri_12186 [Volvox africanus]
MTVVVKISTALYMSQLTLLLQRCRRHHHLHPRFLQVQLGPAEAGPQRPRPSLPPQKAVRTPVPHAACRHAGVAVVSAPRVFPRPRRHCGRGLPLSAASVPHPFVVILLWATTTESETGNEMVIAVHGRRHCHVLDLEIATHGIVSYGAGGGMVEIEIWIARSGGEVKACLHVRPSAGTGSSLAIWTETWNGSLGLTLKMLFPTWTPTHPRQKTRTANWKTSQHGSAGHGWGCCRCRRAVPPRTHRLGSGAAGLGEKRAAAAAAASGGTGWVIL